MPTRKPTPDQPNTLQARHLGSALRARRKALGINMAAAAEVAGMSRVTWHRLEKGEPGVAWGFVLAAAAALGLDLRLGDPGDAAMEAAPRLDEFLPLRIHLADFPGLRRLAWQVGEGVEALTPREAFGLYARNLRHLDTDALSTRERWLLHALREVYGEVDAGV